MSTKRSAKKTTKKIAAKRRKVGQGVSAYLPPGPKNGEYKAKGDALMEGFHARNKKPKRKRKRSKRSKKR